MHSRSHHYLSVFLLFLSALPPAYGDSSIHVMYYSYFKAEFENENFFQWNGYRSWDGRLHNPENHLGPEDWRYDLALGSGSPGSGMHYPFLGRYDNFSNDEIVLWQFRCMKNAGVDAVCASNLAHSSNPRFLERLLDAARIAGVQVYVLDEVGGGLLEGARNQAELDQAVDDLVEKCNETLLTHATDEAYFKIDGRPVYFLPFWIPGFGTPGVEQLQIAQNALRRFRDGVTVDGRAPWLYSTSVYLANFSGNLSFDLNGPPGPTVHMSQGWAETEFESFTCWDPLGILEQYNRSDIPLTTRNQNIELAMAIYIANQSTFGNTPIVPIQVAFDRRNNEGPGAGGLAPVNPVYIAPHDPAFWRTQIRIALASGAPHIWIAQWNEWHEDQTLEPGWGFLDEWGNEDPFALLRILAEETGGSFSEPPLPSEASVDPVIWEKINGFESPTPTPTQTPTPTATWTSSPTSTPSDSPTPTPTPSPDSDLNQDGNIDALDLIILLEDWGKMSGPGPLK